MENNSTRSDPPETEKTYEDLIQELRNERKKNASLEAELKAGRKRIQVLSRRMLEVQEAERRHIARELHDEIGQALTAVKISLQTVLQTQEAEAFRDRLEEGVAVVERALQQVRNLSLDLRPSLLDDLGLVSALRWYVDQQEKRSGIPITFFSPLLSRRLSPEIETACFRVVQESLTNALRHAQASRIQVGLSVAGKALELVVIDDGVGFDVRLAREKALTGAGLGLLGMEERVRLLGGQLQIRSEVGKGTEIRAVIPLEA